MCKGCGLDDTIGYLENFSDPLDNAQKSIKAASEYLRKKAYETSEADSKTHLRDARRKLIEAQKLINEVRSDL